MLVYATAYAVVPLTSNYSKETCKSVRIIKFYCASESRLPISDALAGFPPISTHDRTDYALIESAVEELLKPGVLPDTDVDTGTVTLPLVAAQFLAKFKGNTATLKSLENLPSYRADQLLTVAVRKLGSSATEQNREFALVQELLGSVHPDVGVRLSPRCEAIRRFLSERSITYSALLETAAGRCSAKCDRVVELQLRVASLERACGSVKQALLAAEAQFANAIALGIAQKASLIAQLEKKKNILKADPNAFAAFVVSHVDAFAHKNPSLAPFIPMVARRFHAILMDNFPLSVMSEDLKQGQVDQLFLARKMKLLANLEQTGIDESVEQIIRSKTIFAHAQTAVLRACLFENPVESASQIVLSLFVVEDLFVCQFGCPPEANQLMPLLANLFILSPMPTPLSFGKWLNHYFQPLMQSKPEWFMDESLRSLEHYFQFNEWMTNMLEAISSSESLDALSSP
jgi:hypothetical protein